MKVRDVMTADVVCVTPDTPLKQVAFLMVERRISGVPVVDTNDAVVGVVSEADFLIKEEGEHEAEPRHPWFDLFATDRAAKRAELERIAARSAGEAMTAPAVTIGPEESLHQAARTMSRRSINRLPVVEDGRLVGIISRADIVRVFARSDHELRERVSLALRAVDGISVTDVRDGVVELTGTVQSKALATAIRSLVQHLDGVMAVDDRNVNWQEEPETVLR